MKTKSKKPPFGTVLLVLALVLSSCSPKNQPTKETPNAEVETNWFAGVGQFNGSLDFGNLTATTIKLISVKVTNQGDSALVGPAVISGEGFSLAYSNCVSLLPNKSCSIKVAFNPADKANGLYVGTISLGESVANLSAGIDLPVVEDNLSVTVGGLDVSSGVDFGVLKYNQNILKSLTIKNNGTHKVSGNLNISNNEASNFILSYDTCSGKELGPKKTCVIKISLSGTGKNGAVAANLAWANLDFPLTGTVQNLETVAEQESNLKLMVGSSAVNPGPINLGTFNLKQDKILTFNLKNTGTDTGIVTAPVVPSELQLLYNSCSEGSLLPVNKACSFKVLANSSSKGSFSSPIQVQGNEYLLQSLVREPGDKIACSIDNSITSNITWDGTEYSQCLVEECVASHHILNNQCDPNVISCPVENGLGSRTWSQNQYGDCTIDSCNTNFHFELNACLSDVKSCPILNGEGSQTWNGFGYTNCLVATCDTDFHKEGNLCVNNTQLCSIENGEGTKLWNGNDYGLCQVSSCLPSFHNENNACVSDSKACNIVDGTGTQTWNSANSTWNTCQVATCNPNFHQDGNTCVANVQVCSIDNAVASQTWLGTQWGECTVQSCNTNFHQAGNTCVANIQGCPIANGTGSQSWNTVSNTWNSCQMTNCNPNFVMNTGTNSCDATIIASGASRTWADGSAAQSCNEYKNPSAGKRYQGSTGDGRYMIKPSGVATAYDVYCDQTTDNGGWTMVINAVANTSTYGWSNAFWTNTTLLNETNFTGLVQSKYSSFNNVSGSNIMMKSYQNSTTPTTIYKGAIGSSKTFYSVMQSPQNTVIGEIRINAVVASTHGPYGTNYSRVAANSGNVYHMNIGYGNYQTYGCPETSGPFGVNNSSCTSCVYNKDLYGFCGGNANLWNAQIFIK